METFYTSDNFISLAKHYIKSADVLLSNKKDLQPFTYASIFFCIGQSLELGFCAFLLKNGVDAKGQEINEAYLRRVGHNLVSLAKIARDTGLNIDDNFFEIIGVFNEYYRGHCFRYPHVYEMDLPSAEGFFSKVSLKLEIISAVIGA